MEIFSGTQGQLTPQLVVWSGRIWNSSELSCMLLLPASMKRMDEKPRKSGNTVFSHYNPIGAICCNGNQSSDPIWLKTWCSLSPTQMMLLIQFHCDWPAGCRNIHVWKCGQRGLTSTDGHRLDWYTISSPWAFGSGELTRGPMVLYNAHLIFGPSTK